jgi:fibronectin-binding autotransporter adhesin
VTEVDNGTLSIDTLTNGGQPSSIGASLSASSNLQLAGGTLKYTGGNVTTDRGVSVTSSFGVTPVTPAIDVGSANVTFTGDVTSASAGAILVKTGSGTLTLGGSGAGITSGTAYVGLNLRVLQGTVVLARASTPDPLLGTVLPNSGAAGLEVYGGATVQLAGTGNNQLYAGAVSTANGVYTLYPGATLDLNGHNAQVSQLQGAGTVTNTAPGTNITLSVNTGNPAAAVTFAGTISDGAGTVGLVKGGFSDTFIFTGVGNFSGPVSVFGGTLQLDYTTNFANKLPSTQPLNLYGGALTVIGTPTVVAQSTLAMKGLNLGAGAGVVNSASGNTLIDFTANSGTLTRGTRAASVNFIVGTGTPGIKVPGAPSSQLGGWATVNSGGTTTFAGLDANNFVVPVPTTTKNDISTWLNGDNVVNSAAFTNTLPAATTNVAGITFNFAGAATVGLGGNTLAVNNGVLATSVVAANASTISGGTLTGPASGGDLILNNLSTGSMAISANIADNGSNHLNVVKAGTGSIALSGTNTYSGNLYFDSGTVTVSNAAALPANTQVIMDATTNTTQLTVTGLTIPSVGLTMTTATPGTRVSDLRATLLSSSGAAVWGGPITLGGEGLGTIREDAGTFAINGPITGTGDGILILRGNGGTGTINGTITMPTTMGLLKTDADTWVIASTGNTWGITQVASSGVLRLGANNALPQTAQLVMGQPNSTNTATLDLGGFNQSVAQLSTVGTTTGTSIANSSTTADSTLTVTGPLNSTYNGVIKDVLSPGTHKVGVTLTGGTLTLSGANTYTGPTTLNGGALRVTGSLAAGSAVAVNATADVGGTGTINGPVSVNLGGTIEPGTSVGPLVDPTTGGGSGKLSLTSPSTWFAGGNYVFKYSATTGTLTAGTNYTTVSSTSTLDLSNLSHNNPFTINIQPVGAAGTPGTPVTYTLGTFTNGGANNGVLSFDPTMFTFAGPYAGTPSVSVDVATGNQLLLTFTPAAVNAWIWLGSSNGTWYNAGNWAPTSGATSSPNTQLTFAGTTNAAMTNDTPGTFTLNAMTFTAAAPAYSLAGNQLNFQTTTDGVAPKIVQNAPNAVAINAPVNLTNTVTISGTGNFTIGGAVTGPGGLTMNGYGKLTMSNTPNTYSGGTAVLNGTVSVASDAALGTGNVTGSAAGTLAYTASTSTSRTFNMSGGTITIPAGKTLTLSGSTVANAYLDGAGAFATGASGATFNGVFTTPSVTLTSTNAADRFLHFDNSGALAVAAGVNGVGLNGFTNQGSGSVTAGQDSQVSVANFQSYGTLTLAPGSFNGTSGNVTQLTNTGSSPLSFNTGSRTFISTVAQVANGNAGIDLHGNDAIVAGGLFVNNGFVYDSVGAGNHRVVADYGALVKGAGFYQPLPKTINGGTFIAGNSPGRATTGTIVLGGPADPAGGLSNYTWQINDAGPSSSFSTAPGVSGPSANAASQVSGWGLLVAVQRVSPPPVTNGNFQWDATSTDQFTIHLQTLLAPNDANGNPVAGGGYEPTGDNTAGLMSHFDSSLGYTWRLFQYQGTYTGPTDTATLDASTIFDASGFLNAHPGRFDWVLNQGAKEMDLVYTPTAVPEPGTLSLIGLAGLAAGWRLRRKAQKAARG